CVRQTQISKLEMMPVSLAVSRYVNEISTRGRTDKLFDQSAARREGAFESDRACEWSMVEENRERPAGSVRVTEEIWPGCVDDALSLIRRKDHIAHALFDEEREYLIIRRRLR